MPSIRSPRQLANRRRIERGVRLVAPILDLVLVVGDRVSRVAGRNQVDPEPPRPPLGQGATTRLAGRADQA